MKSSNEDIPPIVIGIAGGSGSGKTTVAEAIINVVGRDKIAFLHHDSYYKDLRNITPEERFKRNFDHPDSLDTDLLIEHINKLKEDKPVRIPSYDFKSHTRLPSTTLEYPRKVILVEGILIYAEPNLRDLMDVKLFVDTDDDIRFIRRLDRDIHDRGRSVEPVIEQYLSTVRPMHLEFVEPSKRYADIIIPQGGYNKIAIEMVTSHIKRLLKEDES